MPFLYSTRLFQRAEQFGTNIDLIGRKITMHVTRCRFPRGGVKMANSIVGIPSYLRPQ